MALVPVDSTLDSSGDFAVLKQRLGVSEAAPIPLDDPADVFNNFDILMDSLSISVAAKLNVGSIFTSEWSANQQGFYFDAMAYTDRYRERVDPTTRILGTRWGVGLRVLLRVDNVKTDVNLNFGMVSAAVALNLASATYQIKGIGLGLSGFSTVLGELNSIGDFNYETYTAITNEIVPKVQTLLLDDTYRASLKPAPIAVDLGNLPDPISDARAVFHAIRMIKDGKSRDEALSHPVYDAHIVNQTYDQIAPRSRTSERPSDAERNVAREAWDVG